MEMKSALSGCASKTTWIGNVGVTLIPYMEMKAYLSGCVCIDRPYTHGMWA